MDKDSCSSNFLLIGDCIFEVILEKIPKIALNYPKVILTHLLPKGAFAKKLVTKYMLCFIITGQIED